MKAFLVLVFFLIGCTTIPSDTKNLAVRSGLVDSINDYRYEYYFDPLIVSKRLECAAALHASYIGSYKYCSHIGRGGTDEEYRGEKCGFLNAQDQVIACNVKYADTVVDEWMVQLSSRVTLLSPVYSQIGCAMYNYYWVCVLAY